MHIRLPLKINGRKCEVIQKLWKGIYSEHTFEYWMLYSHVLARWHMLPIFDKKPMLHWIVMGLPGRVVDYKGKAIKFTVKGRRIKVAPVLIIWHAKRIRISTIHEDGFDRKIVTVSSHELDQEDFEIMCQNNGMTQEEFWGHYQGDDLKGIMFVWKQGIKLPY